VAFVQLAQQGKGTKSKIKSEQIKRKCCDKKKNTKNIEVTVENLVQVQTSI